jgi:CheY-like chemotaxis protein
MATVLIADDSPSIRNILRLTLSSRHAIIEAKDGSEALVLLRQLRPAVAIFDVRMPGPSGLQLCWRIRADPYLRSMGVIILSATASNAEAQSAGADGFMPKPFSPSQLLAVVEGLTQAGKPEFTSV